MLGLLKIWFYCCGIRRGLEQIFKDIGVDYVVKGRQSMNPSTEDILDAVERVNAQSIFVLPNNKNIILAAEQAASLAIKTLLSYQPNHSRHKRSPCL